MKYDLQQISEFSFLVKIKGNDLLLKITALYQSLKLDVFFKSCIIIPSYKTIYLESPFDVKFEPDFFLERLALYLENFNFENYVTTSNDPLDIPILYDPEVGKDLPYLALKTKLKVEEIIKIHSERIYDIYTIGFLPGFAYLGDIDKRLHLPRKDKVEKNVPAGTLAIAENQTAIYPLDSPGGWHQIGRLPEKIMDEDGNLTFPFKIGGKVKFTPLSRNDFISMGGDFE